MTGNKETTAGIFRCSRILQTLDTRARELGKPLTEATKAEELEPTRWSAEMEKADQAIKGALASAIEVDGLLRVP